MTAALWLILLAPAPAAAGAPAAAPAVAPAAAVAAPAPRATTSTDTMTTSYEASGIRVIHRQVHAHEGIAVNLYLLGGSAQLDSATAGIETMLLRISEYGTGSYPGREARLALGRTGSHVVISPAPDWTLAGFRGLRSEFDSTWAVFADRLMRPSLEPEAVELVRARMLRWVRNETSHPDAIARRIARRNAYAGHPYEHDPEGSEASLAGITVEDLRRYHHEQMVRSRMLLVVVGNIERGAVEAAVARTLGRLPAGDYTWRLPPAWTAGKATVTVHEQQLPTNYILGYFAGPPSDSRDYQAFRIALNILGGWSFGDIRENGLSYAAGAPFLPGGASSGSIYVSTTRPDTAVRIFNANIRLVKESVVSRSVLQRYYRSHTTDYYYLNENTADQAHFLARHELLHGDWRLAGRYLDELKSVSGTDIRRAAQRYIRNIQYVYVGNPAIVPTKDMTKY